MTDINLNDGLGGVRGADFVDGTALYVKDLACLTWAVGIKIALDGALITTVGPPFPPLIMPAPQASTLDPSRSIRCTGLQGDPFGLVQFQIFDPPIVLTPELAMMQGSSVTLTSRSPGYREQHFFSSESFTFPIRAFS